MPAPSPTALKDNALALFAARAPECETALAAAMQILPEDDDLLVAYASLAAEKRLPEPLKRIETVLRSNPGWVAGHRTVAHLRSAFELGDPLALIEAALETDWNRPQLTHCYLGLLSALGRNDEAMERTADLRRRVGDVPGLRLLEARFAGLAGHASRGQSLLLGLPEDLPELAYQRVRNALQRGEAQEACALLDRSAPGRDMRLWALAELAWRAAGDPRHRWLLRDGSLFQQFEIGLQQDNVAALCELLRGLHTTRAAPLSQSLRHGTQTLGHLHLRKDPALVGLFSVFREALGRYAASTSVLEADHPLSRAGGSAFTITASWSVRLTRGGFHMPHIHSEGRVSSACYLFVPADLRKDEGVLELGRPPGDIPLPLGPVFRLQPRPGRLVLFPSFMYHSTSPFGAGERLTAVFDAA